MDLKVKEVQQWLINEYGNKLEFKQYINQTNFNANGYTDGKTMKALVYALQYELNIDSPNGSFGPLTISKTVSINSNNANMENSNLVRILKGGFWCHGYNPGYNDLHIFEEQTTIAINSLKEDIGIAQNGTIEGYVWKALLTTDAFVTTWSGGSNKLREVQQSLNGTYLNGYSFVEYTQGYIPTDGLGSRQLSNALIIYIQALAGDLPTVVAPSLGPYTQGILRNNPLPGSLNSGFVKLAGYMLRVNGYYNAPIESVWSSNLSAYISDFQRNLALPITGKLDFSTWMSGLISYGDKNRKYTACDTRFEITYDKLTKLKSMQVNAIGRYLTGGDFKGLRPDEVFRIIDNDMGLIPIFQKNGTTNNNFSYDNGILDAIEALDSAIRLGIPLNSIIYFAVDYDPQDSEISRYIIPYFQAIRSVFLEKKLYKIGIYGTRNVCSRTLDSISEVVTSYVSNMSSGYSGNLGFKMPNDWTFDQFDEIYFDNWGIDKVIYSGKHPYVNNSNNLPNYNNRLFSEFEIYGDDFSIQPQVYINLGKDASVKSTKGDWPSNIGHKTFGKTIGKVKKGQYFTKMGLHHAFRYSANRIIFTAANGKAAYGYADNIERASTAIEFLDNIELFHHYYFDESTNSLQKHKDLFSSPNPLEFTVKKSVEYHGENSKLGMLPVGTKLYLEKTLASDGNYYTDSIAGKKNPNLMQFHKMKLPGGSIQKIDSNHVLGYGWVDLGYSLGTFGPDRAIY